MYGQNHIYNIYNVYTGFFAGFHQSYGHMWRVYTVLANPVHKVCAPYL